ncbi:LacI family DNA-binding transcriptional regulator [Halomonas sp. M5N1S15]|nr:LacI family DNA-binding transcriptional regulator [Halomonas alkalisoli]MCE9682402.1 LacI family DNA-binding transcriptional regulator [Halomonas alkalisoli]
MPARSTRHVTIIEVAREAGASKTSVSRYFGDERDRLSRGLQGRIAAAAKRLGYRPNQMARSLKGGHSRLIGMLVADIRNPFSVAVMHGVEQACRASGYSLLACNTDNDPAQESAHLSLLASYRVEGLVINATGSPHGALQALIDQGTPLVLLDREVDRVAADVVGLDNPGAVDMALAHFAERGYRELLYITEPPEEASPRQRRMARFQARLADFGMVGESLCLPLTDGTATPHAAIAAFLNRPGVAPKALLCANGKITLAVTRTLQALGVRLGETGLMGIDELDWCELVAPGITTLAQPTEAIGRAAVECLMQRREPQHHPSPPRHIHYQPVLMPRGSTQR